MPINVDITLLVIDQTRPAAILFVLSGLGLVCVPAAGSENVLLNYPGCFWTNARHHLSGRTRPV